MAGFLFPSNPSTSSTPASSFLSGTSTASSTPSSSSLFGTPAASSTPASSFLFGTSTASSTPSSSSLFGTPAASSTPASSSLFGASSVFGSSSGLGFYSNLFGYSISRASTTTTTSSFSSAFFGSSSSNSATSSPAFASSPFGASSTPSFSNLFGSPSSSTSSSSASPFPSTVSPFSVSSSPFSGSTSAFSTQSPPAFSFPSTAGSSADSISPFSLSSAPARSSSTTTSSSLFTASSPAAPGFSFPSGSNSISPSSLFAASSSSASTAVPFSVPTGSSSTFASSSAQAFSFPTGSNPAFSAGVDAVAVMTVEKRDEEAVPKPIEVGLVTVTAGLETEAVAVDIAEATFPNPREDGKPDEDEVPKEKLLNEELDVAEGVGEERATDAELPVPFDTENAGLEPLGNENPGIAELPVPFASKNDEEFDVSEGVGDVSTPGASTVTSGIAFPSFGVSSSSTTTTTATSTTAIATSSAAPTVSFPSFGNRSTAASPGSTGLSFSLSTKTPTTASASHPQSTTMFAGSTSSTNSAAQSTSALAAVSCSGTTSTVSAAVASAPKLPSEITGKTVEEIIKGWNAELQECTGKIRKQATAKAEWDRRILHNCDVLLRLETEVAIVVEMQTNLERQLELIETHQEEVDNGLQSMEYEAERIYKDERGLLDDEVASTRDAMYEQAESIERELEKMTKQIKSIIQVVNASQAGGLEATDGMTPLDVVVRILSNQLSSLMWIDEKVDDDEADIPLVARSRTLQAKSCTVTLPVSHPVDHPTVIVDEVEESATHKSSNLTMPIREPMSPHDDCVSLDANDSLSNVVLRPIIGAVTYTGGFNAHDDVPEFHGSPQVEMEGESISPTAHADHGGSGSALVDCNVALDPPSLRRNLSDPCVDFHHPPKDSAEPSSAREGISFEPSGGAIRDGQVGMTSKDIFHGATDDTHASKSLDFSLLGHFPHAAVQTARIKASTTTAISQEMPHGSTSLPAASTGPRVNPFITSKMAPSRSSFDISGGLASWRGFQVSSFSRESLERLSTQFPHMLDRFQLRTSYFQTLVLDSLAGLGDEMHNMLVSEVQEADLDRLKCIIDDLSIVGIDVSFFGDRLDVVASARRAADLSSAIAMRCHEHAVYTGELSSVESETKDLRIKLEKMESVAKDLRAILTENEKARDAAIADLEALYTSSAQLDPSLSLDQGLL